MLVGNIYVIAAVAVVGGGLFGFDISSMSAIIGTNAYKCYFNQGMVVDGNCQGPNAATQGGITAAMPAGSWLGAIISGPVSDRLGRKTTIMLGCIIWIIGSTIICASQDIGMLIAGRIINGLCVGMESAQVPVYISELAPPSKRGRLVGMQQWAITWGILILYYISYGASFIGPQNSTTHFSTAVFRVPWGLQMIPAVFLFVAMIFLPESPRWYARKDRWEECHKVLTLVHGKGDPQSPLVNFELQEIQEMARIESQNKDATYFELFKPNMINRTHIAVFTQIWSQLTGMNVMMYYINYVFLMAGYKGNANLLASSIQYVINVAMTVPALIWLDRWGRRPTMLIGSSLMMVWMFANAGILSHGQFRPDGIDGTKEASMLVQGSAAKGLIACTYLFVASYAPTWGPVSWVYPPELFPLRLRGKGVALATSANWAFNTALGAFTPPAFEQIRWKVYLVFGIFNFAMTIHAFFLFPETAGKTLEDTALMFEDPQGPKYIGTLAWKTKIETKTVVAIEKGEINPEKLGSIVYHEEVRNGTSGSDSDDKA